MSNHCALRCAHLSKALKTPHAFLSTNQRANWRFALRADSYLMYGANQNPKWALSFDIYFKRRRKIFRNFSISFAFKGGRQVFRIISFTLRG